MLTEKSKISNDNNQKQQKTVDNWTIDKFATNTVDEKQMWAFHFSLIFFDDRFVIIIIVIYFHLKRNSIVFNRRIG